MPDSNADLERFLEAQHTTFERAKRELWDGEKRSHWMWYIFPQLRGLGRSETSRYFGIANISEARAYLAHPILGARLVECTRIVLATPELTPVEIFGGTDALKFHSCLTLFSAATNVDMTFNRTLDNFYDGAGDPQTLSLLNRADGLT